MSLPQQNSVWKRLGELLERVRRDHAANLARSGRYDEAIQVLGSVGSDTESEEVLDLRARIAAQRGQFLDAEQLWREVLRRNPNHEGASKGLDRLRRMNRRKVLFVPVVSWSVLTITVVIALVTGWYYLAANIVDTVRAEITSATASIYLANLFSQAKPSWQQETRNDISTLAIQQRDQARQLQELTAIASNIAVNQDEITRRLVAVEVALGRARTAHEALLDEIQSLKSILAEQAKNQEALYQGILDPKKESPTPSSPARTPPSLELIIPGVLTTLKNDTIVVTFAEDLFARGILLKRKSALTLRAVASVLRQHAGELNIRITGCAAPSETLWGTETRNHFALSLRRAEVVANFLLEHAHCAPSQLTVQGSDPWDELPLEKRPEKVGKKTVFLEITRR